MTSLDESNLPDVQKVTRDNYTPYSPLSPQRGSFIRYQCANIFSSHQNFFTGSVPQPRGCLHKESQAVCSFNPSWTFGCVLICYPLLERIPNKHLVFLLQYYLLPTGSSVLQGYYRKGLGVWGLSSLCVVTKRVLGLSSSSNESMLVWWIPLLVVLTNSLLWFYVYLHQLHA